MRETKAGQNMTIIQKGRLVKVMYETLKTTRNGGENETFSHLDLTGSARKIGLPVS